MIRDPFFNRALRIERFRSSTFRKRTYPRASLQDGIDRPECCSHSRRDLTIGCLEERRTTCERKRNLEAAGFNYLLDVRRGLRR